MTRKKNPRAICDTVGGVWTPPVTIGEGSLAAINEALEFAGQTLPPGFVSGLEAIAGEYRAFQSLQNQEPSPGEKRESIARIKSLARELRQAIVSLDFDTVEALEDRFAVLTGDLRLRESASLFLETLEAAAGSVRSPKTRPKDEAKAIAAVALWSLFDKCGLPFTGYDNNEHGLPGGIAAACLRVVFGEPDARVGYWHAYALRECGTKN